MPRQPQRPGLWGRLFGGKAKQSTALAFAAPSSIGTLASYQFDPNGPAVELPVYGVPPPTMVAAVNAAITGLEQGQFYAAAYLADAMTRDDRVRAKQWERIDSLTGAPMEIEPAKDTARARRIAEDYEERNDDILPSHQVGKLLKNGLMLGTGIAQVRKMTTADGEDLPTIYVWNNRFLRWDWTLRAYCLQTENRGEIVLEAGDPEWVIYEPYGPLGWVDAALVRALAVPWLMRYWSRAWWARHQEIHGTPIRAGIIPVERDPTDEKTFLRQLANLAHEATIRLPQGLDGNKFDVKLIEATSNSWEGFSKLLEHCDDSIAILFVGQSQSTNGQGGLGTQENAGESTLLRLTRGDAKIYRVLRTQVLKPYVAATDGDGDMAPYLCPQIEPPEDESERAKTDLIIGQAVQAFKTAEAPIHIRKYLEKRGYGDVLMTEQEIAAAEADEEAEMSTDTPTLVPNGIDDPPTEPTPVEPPKDGDGEEGPSESEPTNSETAKPADE